MFSSTSSKLNPIETGQDVINLFWHANVNNFRSSGTKAVSSINAENNDFMTE